MRGAAIVIGAQADELVAAHALARAGCQVTVLDPLSEGGQPPAAPGWVAPQITRLLGLAGGEVRSQPPDPWLSAALPGGGVLSLWRDMPRSVAAIRAVSASDAAKWPQFCARMARLARLLERVYLDIPPDPVARGSADLVQLGGLALRMRGLGRQGMEDLLRLVPMPAADFLDDSFESPALKGMLGAVSVANLCLGPRSGGTALRLLHHHVGSPAGVFRLPPSNLREILAARPGIEIRRGAAVAEIIVRAGRVVGVWLGDGKELPAAIVVSGIDPKHTLLDLVDPGWLEPELARAVRNVRSRGVVAHVKLILDRAPRLPSLVLAPSLDCVERAYDDAKHGRAPAAPILRLREVHEAADGRHSALVEAQYAPRRLSDGSWDDERRRALAAQVAGLLAQHDPGFAGAVVEDVVSPRELEADFGWPEGQEDHAESALDQLLWMRPVPELARYRTPVGGLYLCGPAMHPGGGIAGACGYHAAREILRDLRRGRNG